MREGRNPPLSAEALAAQQAFLSAQASAEVRPACTCGGTSLDDFVHPDECALHGGDGAVGRCAWCGEWAWAGHPCFRRPWYARALQWLLDKLDPLP